MPKLDPLIHFCGVAAHIHGDECWREDVNDYIGRYHDRWTVEAMLEDGSLPLGLALRCGSCYGVVEPASDGGQRVGRAVTGIRYRA